MINDRADTRLFLEFCRGLLERGTGFRFQACGTSMMPTIRHKEIVRIEPVKAEQLRRGDVVLFAEGNELRLHRLVVVDHDKNTYVTRGDALAEKDACMGAAQIIGRAVAIERTTGAVSRQEPLRGVRVEGRRLLARGGRGLRGVVRRFASAAAMVSTCAVLCGLLAIGSFMTPPAAFAQGCAVPGSSGDGGTLSGVVNTYYPGTQSAAAGSTSIHIGTPTGSSTQIGAGDLLLVIQMQDADFNLADSSRYGSGNTNRNGSGWTNLHNVGKYEFVRAAGPVSGGVVPIFRGTGTTNSGLLNAYTYIAGTSTFQVVRVPQYSTARLGPGLTAAPWSGNSTTGMSGGILVIDVAGPLDLGSATVSVDGLGFRGGAGLQLGGGTGNSGSYYWAAPTTYAGTQLNGYGGASKGEGIAGTPRWVQFNGTYLNTGVDGYAGSMGRGAPGNAGGGGNDNHPDTTNDENSGGGGGANANGAHTGNVIAGGLGGNSWNSNNAVGGIGGSTIVPAVNLVVMGGGGGAGSRNDDDGDNEASSGGAGGGIVIIRAGSLSGTGTITANGAAAYNNTLNDAAGGGGAGGSVVVVTSTGSTAGLAIQANGGRGGDAWATHTATGDRHGPGGGGGGGAVFTSGAPTSVSVTGGASGITSGGSTYGADAGQAGYKSTAATLAGFSGIDSGAECAPDLTITSSHTASPYRGDTNAFTYSLTVSNVATTAPTSGLVTVVDVLPFGLVLTGASGTNWTCSITQQTATCTRTGALSAGSTYPERITISAIAAQTAPDQVSNTATVSGGGDVYTGNNTATDPTTVQSLADLAVTTAATAAVSAGGNIIYSQAIKDNGPSDATNPVFLQVIPANTTFSSVIAPLGWSCSTPAVGASGVVSCAALNLAASATASANISVVVTVNPGTAPGTVISGTAQVASLTVDGISSNNTKTVMTAVQTTGQADLAVNNVPSQNPVQTGVNLSFSQTVTNAGTVAATGAQFTNAVPANTSYVSMANPDPSYWTCTYASNTVTCNANSAIPAGWTGTFVLTLRVNSGASIAETARVAAGNDANAANNTALATVTIVGATGHSDVALATAGSPSTVVAGGYLSYTHIISVNGPGVANAITFSQTIPANTTFQAITFPADIACTTPPAGQTGTISCSVPAGAPAGISASVVVNVKVDPNTTGSISSTAQVTESGDTITGNNTTNTTTTVITRTDLALTTTASPGSVAAGANITYLHTIANAGPSTAVNVKFTEALPANTTFQSITPPAGWSCTTTSGISCTRASFAPGAPVTLQVVLKVNSGTAAGSVITASSSVSSDTFETNPMDNAATVSTSVSGAGLADLAVTNVGAPAGVYAGRNITYTQNVTNKGSAAAASITFAEVVPTNTTFVSLAAPAGWTCSKPAVGSGGTVSCTIASLAANASAAFSLVVAVNTSTPTGAVITDTASISSGTTDPNSSNNSASTSSQVGTQADLSVSVSAPTVTAANTNLTFTQTLVNTGPSSAATVQWTQSIPANTTLVSLGAPAGWSCTTTGTITCTTATFAPGTVSLPLVLHVNSGVASGTAINNSVSVSSVTPDPTTTDHTAANTVIVATAGQADLSVTSVGSPATIKAGANLTFAQQVKNNGLGATTPTFSQSVPLNTTFVSMTAPAGWNCTTPAVGGTGAVSCVATSNLASGASANFSFVVQVNSQAPAGATITNTATVTPTTGDPIPANNTVLTNNEVSGSDVADVGLTMTGDDTILQGNNTAYTAIVVNNGPDTATNILFTDALPTADLSFVSASVTGGSCSESGGVVSCSIASLNNGGTATIAIVATALSPDVITNTANVSADQSDPVASNNSATVTSVITYPTAVKLKNFAAVKSDGNVVLQWSTGSESHNLGFNIYREQNGERVRINPSLIAGSALLLRRGSQAQAAKTYGFVDSASGAGQSAYWLEDVDVNGIRTMHGPAYASAGSAMSGSAHALTAAISRTATFAELSQQQASSQPIVRSHIVRASLVPNNATTLQQQIQFALAAMQAVKIQIAQEGWYRVPVAQLIAAGLRLQNLDSLHLFAEGIEQPILITTGVEGSAIEFYGTGIDTQYSKTRVYWLVQGDTRGARIQKQSDAGQSGLHPQSFEQTVELRDRTTFFAALMTSDGDNFFGDMVSTSPLDQVLVARNVAAGSGQPVTVEVVLQGVFAGAEHDVDVSFNGAPLGQVTFEGQAQGIFKVEVPFDLLREGANTVTLTALNGDDDISLVDHIALVYPRAYVAEGDSLKFTAGAGDNLTIGGFTASPTRVVDITDPAAPVELQSSVSNDGDTYSAQVQVPSSGLGPHILIAVAPGAVSSPAGVVSNTPSRLHLPQRGANLVMIAHPDFVQQLTPLVQLRRREGYTVSVVTTDEIYDEFNFGEKSPRAIRDFLKTAGVLWSQKPKYLLLVGDASVDPLNNIGMGSFDFVPTKIVPTSSLMTASDDWFSDFTDAGVPQISTGRLPARTAEQARALVAKIVGYESNTTSDAWTRQVLMVADKNDDQNFSADSQSVQALLSKVFQVTDVLATDTDPATASNSIISGINSGKLLVNYIGHGAVDSWSDSNLLDIGMASSLQNGTRLPVVFAISCLNGYFYDVYQESMASALVFAPNGGAVAVVASSGLTDSEPQVEMDRNLVKNLAANPNLALGDALRLAKSAVADPDVRRTYMLFGDPAMRLAAPWFGPHRARIAVPGSTMRAF